MKGRLVVVGGGPAGMGAALEAHRLGVEDIVIIERDIHLGGILQQCIHTGFGLELFGEELTGVEYGQRFIDDLAGTGIKVLKDTMVVGLKPGVVRAVSSNGAVEIRADAVILAMGCRERTRGALKIPGTRPAGIFTAGSAQRLLNIQGLLPGKKAVILGSGDVGLIMARRLSLEGAVVSAVVEIMPWSNGLPRNLIQCLEDFAIPLLLSHTIVGIEGRQRIEGVHIAPVDERLQPQTANQRFIPCDLLLLSVGLLPETELCRQLGLDLDPLTGGPCVDQHMQTSLPGVFACGNVVHVHDLVDWVTVESRRAAAGAATWLAKSLQGRHLNVKPGENIHSVVPQRILSPATEDITLSFRVKRPFEKPSFALRGPKGVLLQKQRREAQPAIMVELKVPANILPLEGELVIECRGDER